MPRAGLHMRALLAAFSLVWGRRSLEVEPREQHHVELALAGEVAGHGREPVDVAVPPRARRVREQVLRVDRAVRVPDEVNRPASVGSVGRLDDRFVRLRKPSMSGVRRGLYRRRGYSGRDVAGGPSAL